VVDEVSLRETYGKTLAELGKKNRDIVVLDADLCPSTMTQYFMKAFPDRFFDVGIAEQNMIGIAAGFAASGKIPFASTFAVFAPGRCFDQIRVSVAQAKLNVKIVTTHSGVTVGEDGASHQALEDMALICSLPGFTVIVPADAIETAQAVEAAVAHQGPCYIRLCRPKLPVVYDNNYRFEIGKAVMMKQGADPEADRRSGHYQSRQRDRRHRYRGGTPGTWRTGEHSGTNRDQKAAGADGVRGHQG